MGSHLASSWVLSRVVSHALQWEVCYSGKPFGELVSLVKRHELLVGWIVRRDVVLNVYIYVYMYIYTYMYIYIHIHFYV